jgi:broad specificity phosphatase PhoE
LSEAGIEQVIAACQKLSLENRSPTVIKYSLAASCIDTADIVQRELKIGRERVIPEFTFLDPRAIGKVCIMLSTLHLCRHCL